MMRLPFLLVFSASVGSLKLKDPETGSITFDEELSFEKMPAKSKSCGIVQYAFGKKIYIDEGLQASQYIRSLTVEKGWCHHDPELSHIPVIFFTDHESGAHLLGNSSGLLGGKSEYGGVEVVILPEAPEPPADVMKAFSCPPGVECHPEQDLPPYPAKDQKVSRVDGGWKFRWYHAQVLLRSPYTFTLYLDVDAVPCSGAGITHLVKKMEKENGDIGTTVHKGVCEMSPTKTCSSHTPPGANKKEWTAFSERNDGVVIADMTEGKVAEKIIQMFAQEVVAWAGKAKGDQFAFRRAMFHYRKEAKAVVWSNDEVCRYKQYKGVNACKKGCQSIAHQYKGHANQYIPKNIPPPKDMEAVEEGSEGNVE